MEHVLNIPELKCWIINFLDLKSIGMMMRVDRSTKYIIQKMPIYLEIRKSLTAANIHSNHLLEKLFYGACVTGSMCIIENIYRNYWNIFVHIIKIYRPNDSTLKCLVKICKTFFSFSTENNRLDQRYECDDRDILIV